jgi:hypothetical protein
LVLLPDAMKASLQESGLSYLYQVLSEKTILRLICFKRKILKFFGRDGRLNPAASRRRGGPVGEWPCLDLVDRSHVIV